MLIVIAVLLGVIVFQLMLIGSALNDTRNTSEALNDNLLKVHFIQTGPGAWVLKERYRD